VFSISKMNSKNGREKKEKGRKKNEPRVEARVATGDGRVTGGGQHRASAFR
jgi:hypothetical protein